MESEDYLSFAFFARVLYFDPLVRLIFAAIYKPLSARPDSNPNIEAAEK